MMESYQQLMVLKLTLALKVGSLVKSLKQINSKEINTTRLQNVSEVFLMRKTKNHLK